MVLNDSFVITQKLLVSLQNWKIGAFSAAFRRFCSALAKSVRIWYYTKMSGEGGDSLKTEGQWLASVGVDEAFVGAVDALETAVGDWTSGQAAHAEGSPAELALSANREAARRRLIATTDAIIARRVARASGARCFDV